MELENWRGLDIYRAIKQYIQNSSVLKRTRKLERENYEINLNLLRMDLKLIPKVWTTESTTPWKGWWF